MKTAFLLAAIPLSAAGCKKTPPPAAVVVVQQQPTEETGAVDALTPPARVLPPDLLPAAKADTMNGDPGGPKQSAFDAVQADGQRKVQGCLEAIPAATVLPNNSARVSVKFEVGNDGKARAVDVSGDAPADAFACAKSAMEALAFTAYQGPIVRNSFQLSFNRGAPAPAPAATPTPAAK